MIRDNTTLKDLFGDFYYFSLVTRSAAKSNAESLLFADELAAKRFLLRFDKDISQWRFLAREISARGDPIFLVASAVARGKIKVYKVSRPALEDSKGKSSYTSSKSHNTYQIFSANDALADEAPKAKTFASASEALVFLESLDLDSSQVKEHLKTIADSRAGGRSSAKGLGHELTHTSQSGAGMGAAQSASIEALSQEIVNGNLVVLDRGVKRGPTDPSGIEKASSGASESSSVPLGPHVGEEKPVVKKFTFILSN